MVKTRENKTRHPKCTQQALILVLNNSVKRSRTVAETATSIQQQRETKLHCFRNIYQHLITASGATRNQHLCRNVFLQLTQVTFHT